jgi:glycerophosphoryl diester phosphodiesterase
VTPLIVAHRTCPKDTPENSLEGIAKARELSADAVEIDLRVSLEQKPHLLHDWSLHRTTGYWPPIELTPRAIIDRLRLQGGSEGVPTLQAALDALPPELMIAVDVKTPWSIWHLAREIRKRRLEARTLAWCTSEWDVRYMRRFAPEVETAYLRSDTDPAGKLAYLAKAVRLGANAISAEWRAIDPSFVNTAHELGLRVYSWHAEWELTQAKLESGLDGLVTDYPVEARAAYEKLAQGRSGHEAEC